MNSYKGLFTRLARGQDADRRLDSDITAVLLGGADCFLDRAPSVDGWDILQPGDEGAVAIWMDAADVPRLTRLVSCAVGLAEEVAPDKVLDIVADALRRAAADALPGRPTQAGVARSVLTGTLHGLSEEVGRPASTEVAA